MGGGEGGSKVCKGLYLVYQKVKNLDYLWTDHRVEVRNIKCRTGFTVYCLGWRMVDWELGCGFPIKVDIMKIMALRYFVASF